MPKAKAKRGKTMPAKTARRASANTKKSTVNKKTTISSSGLLSKSRFNKRIALVLVLLFAGIGAYLVFFSRAAAVTLATLEAESMALPPGGSVISDSAASGSKAVLLSSTGTATGQFSLASGATSITIRAKGSQCRGAPEMAVRINGGAETKISVSATSWSDYSVVANLPAGSHSLSASFTNDYARKGCDRNLYLDKATIYGTTADSPSESNLAAGKSVTSGDTGATSLTRLTDGDLDTNNYANLSSGPQWVRIDLGQEYSIGKVNLWHYYGDGRTYRDIIVQLSTTADFSAGTTTIFNNDRDNTSGQGAGTDSEYPETSTGKSIVPAAAVNARYVRFWSNGSSVNAWNHYVEAQIFAAGSSTATPPPAPAPAPSPTPSPSTKLSWSPPALSSPTTITVDDSTSRSLSLDTSRDYIIKLGHITKTHGLIISGGRNIVLIGGRISIPYAGTSPSIESRRALYLERNAGTVHIEGLLIDGPDLSEGIQIGAPNAVIQLQNIRMEGIHARDQVNYTDNHPDCIQPWGGVREIRVDRVTCSTDAHGMYWDSNDARRLGGPIGYSDIRRYNMIRTIKSSPWVFQRVTADGDQPMVLTDVYVQPAGTTSLYDSVGNEPWVGGKYGFLPATISADGLTASWPKDTSLTGVIKKGPPPSGDFVPAGTAGTAYVSPGYQ